MKLKLWAVVIGGSLALAGCVGGGTSQEAAPVETATQTETQEAEACFTVAEIGADLMEPWNLVVASKGASDQLDYVGKMTTNISDMYDEVDSKPGCGGYDVWVDFVDAFTVVADPLTEFQSVPDSDYEKVAELGNKLIEVSDDQGEQWDYKFAADESEL
ncbi:hypothetical protein ACP6NG_18135 [Brevibacterium casei]|uniref:hypothetical protein n=1 Tax=Brevibacterium casei TaxID=33889 RepID=UPI003F7E2719